LPVQISKKGQAKLVLFWGKGNENPLLPPIRSEHRSQGRAVCVPTRTMRIALVFSLLFHGLKAKLCFAFKP
jgi:hypothetical protein